MADITMTTNLTALAVGGEDSTFACKGDLLPLSVLITVSVVVPVAIIISVFFNSLVIVAYSRDPLLRTVHNFYLLHLAIYDLVIGSVFMPISLAVTIMCWKWKLGPMLCKAVLIAEYTVCLMAVMMIVLVFWDHLAMVYYGARYQHVETKRKAYCRLVTCWTFSFFLHMPAIAFWNTARGWSIKDVPECDPEFGRDFVFTLILQTISLTVPVLAIIIITILLLILLRKQHHQIAIECRRDKLVSKRSSTRTLMSKSSMTHRTNSLRFVLSDRQPASGQSCSAPILQHSNESVNYRHTSPSPSPIPDVKHDESPISHASTPGEGTPSETGHRQGHSRHSGDAHRINVQPSPSIVSPHIAPTLTSSTILSSHIAPALASSTILSPVKQVRIDTTIASSVLSVASIGTMTSRTSLRRAGRRVVFMIVVLIICWLPWRVCTVYFAAYREGVTDHIAHGLQWLFFFSSCINPFLYTFRSPRFRKNLRAILSPFRASYISYESRETMSIERECLSKRGRSSNVQ